MEKVIETSHAIAEAVRLAKPDVIPIYPVTPQTHIAERLADFVADGLLKAEMITVESEHSAISAAIGASAAGSRVFTATASQGLALMHEVLFIASGLRLPVVMAIANRALSAPINIWCDHSDSIAERDSGWIQLYCESAQEAYDSVLFAYRIAENRDVLLPTMVCVDGFSLSHVYERVLLDNDEKVRKYVGKYRPLFKLDARKPVTMGPIGYPNSFMEFKEQQEQAMKMAINVMRVEERNFKKHFKRDFYGLIETYNLANARYAIIAMGSVCGTIKHVLKQSRLKDIGLIKLRSFRPLPKEALKKAFEGLKAIAVIDRAVSFGNGGVLWNEIKALSCLPVHSFIAGLGGRDITPRHIMKAFDVMQKEKENEKRIWLK
ncbi:pyruvate ferredoxin oxidoreductase [Candidatus Woesearchaeota archaeon]|nr:pyruvate ferredoxin oxidoreductase [Candidatus Woesearchaeota archaeon]RLE40660.1 MAG: pyruvate ferredoxin oxidoreductase [Candidatus Woesearchaeota archaeon]